MGQDKSDTRPEVFQWITRQKQFIDDLETSLEGLAEKPNIQQVVEILKADVERVAGETGPFTSQIATKTD